MLFLSLLLLCDRYRVLFVFAYSPFLKFSAHKLIRDVMKEEFLAVRNKREAKDFVWHIKDV